MKITFLGTSAATSCPLPFCQCSICSRAKTVGGYDLRKRSSLMINDDLLIDLGPDIMAACFMHGVDLDNVRYWLQTHSHSDHFDATHLITRIPEYGVESVPLLHLYASEKCLVHMSSMLDREWAGMSLFSPQSCQKLSMRVHPFEHMETFTVGSYEVTAFASDHDKADGSMLYAIHDGDYTVFYGVDTPAIPAEVWKGFHEKQLQFNMVILDHTYGAHVGGVDHLNADQFIEHVQRLWDEGLMAKQGQIYATHISHEGNPNHAEFIKYGHKHGYKIAYDGLVVELK